MRIGIIGASGGGLLAAIMVKKRHQQDEVVVFERSDKPGRKLNATGNGHANIFNLQMAGQFYNHPSFVDGLLQEFPVSQLLSFFSEIGIATLNKGDLVYPLSYAAKTYTETLFAIAKSLGVEFYFNTKVADIRFGNKPTLVSQEGREFVCDKLILSSGGKSQSNLGSDGSVLEILQRRGIKIRPLQPSLCPLKTKEKTKALSGVRHSAEICLFKEGKCLYQENGEILYKDDGLSGIAIFNASAFIARGGGTGYQVSLDFFPEYREDELVAMLLKAQKNLGPKFLYSLLEAKFADEILKNIGKTQSKEQQIAQIAHFLKQAKYEITGLYGFDASQVSSGGVELSELNADLALKREPSIFLIGEILDIDGLCGGFNLGWALLSAMKVASSL